jgi:hypothetical protein
MKELADYSGDFIRNISYQDFTKDTMAKLLTEFARAMVAMDGFWHTKVADRLGPDEADTWGAEIWGTMYAQHVIPRIRRAVNIQGNDVTAWAKYCQLDPGLPMGVYDYDIDVKSENHAVFTVNRCPALLFMEKEGKGREAIVCRPGGMEHEVMRRWAKVFNPAMEVKALKTPPRKSKDEIPHCQWEIKLEV